MNLSDFLDKLTDVSEERDGWLAKCPGHTDSHPSLRVTVSQEGKVLIKDRAGCSTAGVLSGLDVTWKDLQFMTPDILPDRPADAITVNQGDIAAMAQRLDQYAKQLDDTTRAYCFRRFGLTATDAERLGIGTETRTNGTTTSRLIVPFTDPEGRVGGYQSRAIADGDGLRWSGPHGTGWSKLAWFPGTSDWDEILITEGPSDALTAVALGYDTIAIRGAAHAQNGAVLDTLERWTHGRMVVVAGDGDDAGRGFSQHIVQGLLDRGGRAKSLPVPDGQDLTSWRETLGDRFTNTVTQLISSTAESTTIDATLALRDQDLYPLSDLGNARYIRDIIRGSGSGVKYAPETGFFLLHHGIWRTDTQDRVRSKVHECSDRVRQIANTLLRLAGDDENAIKLAKQWLSWARYCQSSNGISAALRELQALPDVAVDLADFDRHPDLLAAANGVINLRTGELLPHDPGLLLTRAIQTDYRPDAPAPRWERFLSEVFPNYPDIPGYLQRLVGYGITGSTSEQCFAVLWGRGANGKSTFTDTLTEVFRPITVTTPFSTFEERGTGGIPNDIANLKGARLVMASEGEQGKPMAEAVLKRVTGADIISARFLRREFFEFRPSFLLLLASNAKPAFRGQDEGLWRRVKLIPWDRYFGPDERDHSLAADLRAEAAGVLRWAVDGAVRWYRDGLNDPDIIRAATKEYRQNSDALDGFLPGRFFIDKSSTAKVSGKLLYDTYNHWADEENLPPKERWTRRAFFAALEERGAIKRHTNSGAGFEGIVKKTP